MNQERRLSFAAIRTQSVHTRTNLVTIRNMARPYDDEPSPWLPSPEFAHLVDRLLEMRAAGRPVIWSMGAHVIKNGLSRYIIEMVREGFLTHVSGNGATSIHDFELAFMGETSEDVARSIEDGSFGMWEETGRYMNEAIQQGAARGLGYGESLYAYLSNHPERFPHYDDCVFVQCQRSGVPYTCHISIGTDIIHQHPIIDFAALGEASGRDFRSLCRSIAGLQEGGVFLNFGSAISGPEIFLRGLAQARNQGLEMRGIIAANFDIVPVTALPAASQDDPDYHYRPRRVFVDRLQEIGGEGHLFHGLHQHTIPQLFHSLLRRKRELGLSFPPVRQSDELPTVRPLSIAGRRSLIAVDRLLSLSEAGEDQLTGVAKEAVPHPAPIWHSLELDDFITRLIAARAGGHPLLFSLGSNVIASGVNRYLIDLMERGYITHVAVTGATLFQDVELAAFGQAVEDETGGLAHHAYGIWEETGRIIHEALQEGAEDELGYGDSLIAYARRCPQQFPHLAVSLLGACGRLGIPYTCHITIGTDDVQLHPQSDFARQAGASGDDFRIYCRTMTRLEGGVFANFGSAVTGPEVFLKALSIVRNLQHPVHHITTANFDIIRLGNYHRKVGYEDWDYYYRPRKNIIHRPTSLGGKGFHFEGLHRDTIPAIWHRINQLEGCNYEGTE